MTGTGRTAPRPAGSRYRLLAAVLAPERPPEAPEAETQRPAATPAGPRRGVRLARAIGRSFTPAALAVAFLPLLRPWLLARGLELTYWQDRALDVALAAAILLFAATLGSLALRLLGAPFVEAERLLFATGIGLPLLGWAIFLIAVPGLLYRPLILTLWVATTLGLGTLVAATAREYGRQLRAGWALAARACQPWLAPTFFAFGLLIALVFITALAPPVAYDSLMYHLETPKQMLRAHGLVLAQYHQGNYPLTGEVLFLLGLVFGSEVLAHLLHFAAAGLLGWAVWLFTARWAGRVAATVALAAYLTSRTTAALAPIAYIDLFWALWEVLGVFALVWWAFPTKQPNPPSPFPSREGGDSADAATLAPPPRAGEGAGGRGLSCLLVLAGLCFGAAIGAKYLALMMFAVVGPVLFLWAWLRERRFWAGLPRAALAALLFGGIALAVASPWYVKNWLWLGSPLYPWIKGANSPADPNFSADNLGAEGYGLTTSPGDLLSLPLRVYSPYDLDNYTFSHLELDTPTLLFLLAPLLLFAWGMPRVGWWLLLLFFGRAALWAFSLQDVRYLYPALVLLCVPFGMALARVAERRLPAALGRGLLALAIFLAALWPLGVQIYTARATTPETVLNGQQSVYDYIEAYDSSARAVDFMNRELPDGAKVLIINDRRTYYLRHAYVAYEGLPALLATHTDEEMWALLRSWGVTHVALGDNDLGWFDMREAPARVPLRELRNFVGRGGPERLLLLYRDEQYEIYELLPQETEGP